MQQPKWDDPVGDLREFLLFAVPLAAADLLAKRAELPANEERFWEPRMRGLIARGGLALGGHGDQLEHTPRYPAHHKLARRAAGELVYGIAAAALLAGPEGVDIFGTHWCKVPGCRASSCRDHMADTGEGRPPESAPPETVHSLPDLSTWPPPDI